MVGPWSHKPLWGYLESFGMLQSLIDGAQTHSVPLGRKGFGVTSVCQEDKEVFSHFGAVYLISGQQ